MGTPDYWIEEDNLQKLARNQSTEQLVSLASFLRFVLDEGAELFLVYSLKRYRTNENRMFIDNYFDAQRRLRVVSDELKARCAI